MQHPRKIKYRKQQKKLRHIRGNATRGFELNFGDYGLMVLEPGWITARQIESSRVAISREAKRGGKIWINIFPQKPITKKPAETRMGSGKGSPEYWVAEVRPGRIIFEVTGVSRSVAMEALRRAADKMPVKCKIVERSKFLL